MPIYIYRCEGGHLFEELQKISDKPIEKCPKCNKKAERQMGATAFILKGTCWAKDGYS